MVNVVIIFSFAVVGCYTVSKFVVTKSLAFKEAFTEIRKERKYGTDPDENMQ